MLYTEASYPPLPALWIKSYRNYGMHCIRRNGTALQPWDIQSRCIRHRVAIWGSDNNLWKSSCWKRPPSRHVSLSIPKHAVTDALLCTVVHVSCRSGSAAVLHITTSASGPWINRKGGEQEAGSVASHDPRAHHPKTAVQLQWQLVKRGNPCGLRRVPWWRSECGAPLVIPMMRGESTELTWAFDSQ